MYSNDSFTISLIGDPGVGKTSIAARLMGKAFPQTHTPTFGADCDQCYISGKNIYQVTNQDIPIVLWNLGGHERFIKMIQAAYQNSHALILVVDAAESFEANCAAMKRWLNELPRQANTLIHLVYNKIDLIDKLDQQNAIELFFFAQHTLQCKELCSLWLCSAQTDKLVNQINFSCAATFSPEFTSLGQQLLLRYCINADNVNHYRQFKGHVPEEVIPTIDLKAIVAHTSKPSTQWALERILPEWPKVMPVTSKSPWQAEVVPVLEAPNEVCLPKDRAITPYYQQARWASLPSKPAEQWLLGGGLFFGIGLGTFCLLPQAVIYLILIASAAALVGIGVSAAKLQCRRQKISAT